MGRWMCLRNQAERDIRRPKLKQKTFVIIWWIGQESVQQTIFKAE